MKMIIYVLQFMILVDNCITWFVGESMQEFWLLGFRDLEERAVVERTAFVQSHRVKRSTLHDGPADGTKS
jgi:hypothetical protein